MTYINLYLCQYPLRFFQFSLCLRPSLIKNLRPLFLKLIAILFQLLALVFCFDSFHIEMETFILQSFTLGLQSFEEILHAHACATQEFAGAFNNTLVKTQAIGYCQCIAATW